MADDQLFDENNQPAPEQPSGEPAPKAPEPARPQSVDLPDDVKQWMGQATEAIQSVAQRLDNLEGGQPPQGQPEPDAQPPNAQDAFSQFYADPEAFVRNATQRELQAIAPVLQETFTQMTPIVKDRVGQDFDKRYGSGAWAKFIDGRLDQALERLPVQNRANEQYIRALVAGIKGAIDMDPEAAKEFNEFATAAREKPTAPTMLTGNRPATDPNQLSADESRFLEDLDRAGIPFSKKDYLDARNRGSSEEDWGADWMKEQDFDIVGPERKPSNGAAS